MKRKQFTFYRSFIEAVVELPKKYRLELLTAIIQYGLDGIEPKNLLKKQNSVFLAVKPNLDTGRRKALCGSIGGQISKRGPAKKISKGEKEKENEIEIEIETETESEGEGFLRFWERYPVKLGQQEAFDQWKSVCDRASQEDILLGLERWRNSKEWKRESGRFIPKPEKWLREMWWLQWPEQVVPMGATGHLGKAELEAIEAVMKD